MTSETTVKRRIQRHIDNLNSPYEEQSQRAKSYLLRYYGVRALEEIRNSTATTA